MGALSFLWDTRRLRETTTVGFSGEQENIHLVVSNSDVIIVQQRARARHCKMERSASHTAKSTSLHS